MILYPQVNIKEWCEQYKIETKDSPCLKCKEEFPFTIAIAAKKWRGVTQEPHGCGHEYIRSILVPIGEEAKDWQRILNGDINDK